jgi:radical SAM/Cys-rich protein
MNVFDKKIAETENYPLEAQNISTLQVNMGYKCNLTCSHCHVDASPERTEEMSQKTVNRVISILMDNNEITTIDITGGSPEYNPYYKELIKASSGMGKSIIVRTNLAIIAEEGMADLPEFWAAHKVKVVASLPCYTAKGVDVQRGKGTYDKAVSALKQLNSLGYGQEGSGLEIDLMFNPAKDGIAPDQQMLEKAYKDNLKEMHDITFNKLVALSNMPIGRLGKSMSEEGKKEYITELKNKYNPGTLQNLMCRHLISVAPDGNLYDCDFWQMLKLPVKNRMSNDVHSFDYMALSRREIMTAPWCLMCTAGAGASCGGALA